MKADLLKFLFGCLCMLVFSPAFAQVQSCPANINFSLGSLTNWSAYTGNNKSGNGPSAIQQRYDVSATNGVSTINEFQLSSPGIQVLNATSTDIFGGFATIPTINGYQYNNSVLIGSTNIARASSTGGQGGYIRGISYLINVPAGPASLPYTMTYAYAMVLENGTHNSIQQPLFSATLATHDSIITCASPKYFLPTKDNADPRGSNATLDTALARSQGISLSDQVSPNVNPNDPNGGHLRDIWTKGWTEVTFDLSPYRGQQVSLTFEADNCVPGGHFAYAYIALRNTCSGLVISGDALACVNSNLMYSIPALAGASYDWTVPQGWTITSGMGTNIIKVLVNSNNNGQIIAHAVNGCANLRDTIDVAASLPTLAGAVSSDNTVCAGTNTNVLSLNGYRGSILNWISSSDGISWNAINITTPTYNAQNLSTTTIYRAILQNGATCTIDTSSAATIMVDPKSAAGSLSPLNTTICLDQNTGALLTLTGSTGAVTNWQSSQDKLNWTSFNPAYTSPVYSISGTNSPTEYRTIVKSGVCPSDTSSIATVDILQVPFPKASTAPADTTICYGDTAQLNALISIGTKYTWTNSGSLIGNGDGTIPSTPYSINPKAHPLTSTNYMLSIENAGCPNLLTNNFQVHVLAPIKVDAGRDTSIVFNQPLQLHSSSSDTTEVSFVWTPTSGLNNPSIPDPVAMLGANIDSIRYQVKVTSTVGCFGLADILVKVFKTGPDIFVPNAFTPGRSSNSVFRPVPIGISSLRFFRVYNRWGQLVFNTSTIGQGWDGRLNGKMQESGSFVWMLQGATYTGKTISKTGTMVLIR